MKQRGIGAVVLLPLVSGCAVFGTSDGAGRDGGSERSRGSGDAGLVLHVSLRGSDGNDGRTIASALATPAGARDRVRALRASGELAPKGSVTITFHAGVYELGDTFVLATRDSGLDGAPVVYGAAEGERVVWSGGSRFSNWTSQDDGVWSCALPAWAAGQKSPAFRSLWMGDERLVWSGHPGRGSFMHIEAIPEGEARGDWTKGQRAFVYAESDAGVWSRVEPGAEVVTFTRWVDSHLRVESIDRKKRVVRFASPNVFELSAGDLYRIEGAPGLLDDGGEWCVVGDRVCVKSKAKPEGGVVPRLSTLVRLAGEAEAGGFVEHIEFRGIEFAHSRWWFDDSNKLTWPSNEVIGFVQAANGAPGAIVGVGARHVTFDHCRIAHTEAYGMELGKACRDNAIRHCTITDLGAGGLKLGETTIREGDLLSRDNVVEDCTIGDGGKIHHQAIGVWIGQSPGNRLSHNLISDFDYSGISIGWTWGYGPSAAIGNVIEYNEVRNLGVRRGNVEPPLGDMAGIYTLGTQSDGTRTTTIHHNYFHDIAGRTIAWGIYFDEGSTGVIAENNLVLRTTHGSFHQHYGKDNIVRNNILLFGRDAQLWRSRREDHNSFTFERNIVVRSSGVMLNGDWNDHFTSGNNIFWSQNGPALFPGNTALDGWARGRDTGSIAADPRVLIDAEKPWKIAPNSPAIGLGFVPFDLGTVGPRK
ncbi:MAG: right-handed parallel beta-helix repeat-containing protein [Phycisphaerales bacterium]|nr:right-handed parallel beta-helix repeat-containing protein [Phycisphaerales bacterium]